MQTAMTSIFYLQESLSKLNRSFHQKRHVDSASVSDLNIRIYNSQIREICSLLSDILHKTNLLLSITSFLASGSTKNDLMCAVCAEPIKRREPL